MSHKHVSHCFYLLTQPVNTLILHIPLTSRQETTALNRLFTTDNSLLNHQQLNAQIHHKDSTMTTDFNIVHLIGIYVVLFVTLKIAGTVLFWAALLHPRQ